MSQKIKIDIIGAGISGLSVAYFLNKFDRERKLQINIREKSADPGGLAGVFQSDGICVEKFYHHIYRRDTGIQRLIEELKIDGLTWKSSDIGSYFRSRAYRFSSPLDLLSFKPLPPLDRLRLGCLVVGAKMVKRWQDLDDIPAGEYIERHAGKNVRRIVWDPLLKGKFGAHAGGVSAAWLWCKLVDRGSRNSRGKEELGYIRGGFGVIFDRIIDILRQNGHTLHLNTAVEGLESGGDGTISHLRAGGERIATDGIVCCTQVPDIARMLPGELNEYKQTLEKIRFLSVVCLVLILNESLAQFYWNNVYDPDSPFIGVIEHTNWTGTDDFNNRHVVYISAYVDPGDARLRMSAEELLRHYAPHLKRMFPKFNEELIEKALLWTAPYAQPIVETGYRHLVPPMQSPVRNMYVCTMAQIYPHDRQVSNGVDMGEKTARHIINTMEERK